MNDSLRTLTLTCLAIAVVAAVSGCSSQPGTPAKTNPEPPAPLALTTKDTSSTQSLQVGQQLRVTLNANPTTGYQWAVDGNVPAPLAQAGHPIYKRSSGPIGSGGTEVWTFAARATGSGTLKLKYWRSFEATTPPVKTFEVTVDVK